MGLKYLSLILCFSFYLQGVECPTGFVEIEEVCYNKKHIDVLQDFIDLNPSLKKMHPQKIGYQEWTNNQLTFLYLGNYNIEVLPDSIGLLRDLLGLDLRENNIKSIPVGLCNIYPFYTELNLSGNKICPPYPFCFDYIGDQNMKNCGVFKCPIEYIEIDGECYSEEHIQILQSIININPSLKGLDPLGLGKDIGYLGWKNGNLIHLNLVGHGLKALPESLCSIYKKLTSFDVSNNSICPPYPACFEFIGDQNTDDCAPPDFFTAENSDNDFIDNRYIVPSNDIENINAEYFQQDLDILLALIDLNESLGGQNTLGIGKQKWINMRLSSLDISSLGITYLPEKLCDIYSNLTTFNVSNNEICPPYPRCIEYIGEQKTDFCGDFFCPENYNEIDGDCYHSEHIAFLDALIDSNSVMQNTGLTLKPLDVGGGSGLIDWKDGKIKQLILPNNGLTIIPESICNIYNNISLLDISNNAVCPPYPPCIENVGYQNLGSCEAVLPSLSSCPYGFVSFDNKCFYNEDVQVLIDFTELNASIKSYNPLLLGYQLWKKNRLSQLNLDGWNIVTVPENINKLEHLEYLNLNNNSLSIIPEGLCEIYENLEDLQISNNLLCPPYLSCIDFMGDQNTENCEHHFCPYGYTEIEEKCYYDGDIAVLKDFVSLNESLKNRKPLEIGVQKWKNMHLDFLYLGVNDLTAIPESICEIYTNLSVINISRNNVCPPYPVCMEGFVGEQNTSDCP